MKSTNQSNIIKIVLSIAFYLGHSFSNSSIILMNSKIEGSDDKAWAGHDTVALAFVKGKSVLFDFSVSQE